MTDRETEIRSLIRFAQGLGLREATVRIVYEAVVADSEIKRADRQVVSQFEFFGLRRRSDASRSMMG